ncbi:MAG: aminotransferase class III-fold pyridoxal phosphate-dependent enzyme [Thaumarchaeota archaeon]|nr:aminotransferase class III-fold pyridoxal phosphate-dependent enzyme [Nitrososphaerota archaeon]
MSPTEEIYRRNTAKSAKIFAKSKKLHINGVSHNIRFFAPYPFVTKSASGKYLVDVDSNKYVDFWMGHWSLILGHKATRVFASVREQLDKGWMYGTVNKNTIELSEKIAGVTPVAEKIRYVSTGTEATMYAVRLARAITKKKIIAKIDGGWHGYTTDLLKTVNWPFNQTESSGLTDEKHIISLPYNNLEKSINILQSAKNDLAGIIIEPILGGAGCIPATKDYLKGIQEFAKKKNALYILDEIVTGFRFRNGCLYSTMNLDPDIVTLGKIVGGGFPIGVICGKNEIMRYADTQSFSRKDRAYIGGGTFSANPMTMIAGAVTLEVLKNTKSVYTKIKKLGEDTRKKITRAFDGKVITTGKDSLFMTHFVKNGISEINNAEDASKCDTKALHRFHFEMIAKDGIFFLPGKLGAFSNAHSTSDVKTLVTAAERFSENN